MEPGPKSRAGPAVEQRVGREGKLAPYDDYRDAKGPQLDRHIRGHLVGSSFGDTVRDVPDVLLSRPEGDVDNQSASLRGSLSGPPGAGGWGCGGCSLSIAAPEQ